MKYNNWSVDQGDFRYDSDYNKKYVSRYKVSRLTIYLTFALIFTISGGIGYLLLRVIR
ncbi:MAG: hypothetical protein HUU43_15750 [Ignavibacteriaceae bacterium]|nr:hypothetical protein [Ignavibacteriaceae bacterium]